MKNKGGELSFAKNESPRERPAAIFFTSLPLEPTLFESNHTPTSVP